MATQDEIKASYKVLHDDLTKRYYSGASGISKSEFEIQHAKIWTDIEAELKTATDYVEPTPPRNLFDEIDNLMDWAKTKGFVRQPVGDKEK